MSAGAEAMQLALLDAAGAPASWQVRVSWRARRLTIRVFPGGRVEIVVPPGTRPVAVEQFVARHRGWISRKVDEYRSLVPVSGDALPQELRLQASGEAWAVRTRPGAGNPRVRAGDGTLWLAGDPARPLAARHALQRWVMRRAREILVPWLDAVAADCGLPYAGAQIRRQRTRWGSCSPRRTISLNASLVFQPPEVVRYLLVHELVHTRHLDHSRRFWSLVARHEPRWRELDAELVRGWRHVPPWFLR